MTFNPFQGMNDADAMKGTFNYFKPNHKYLVKVSKVETGQTRKPKLIPFFAAQCEIIESDCPSLPSGVSASFWQSLRSDFAHTNIRKFLGAVLHLDPEDNDQDWESLGGEAVSEKQPLEGQMVHVTTIEKIGKESGKPYTLFEWAPYEDQ